LNGIVETDEKPMHHIIQEELGVFYAEGIAV
jgi:hypothetical protein